MRLIILGATASLGAHVLSHLSRHQAVDVCHRVALVRRYLGQMMEELGSLRDPADGSRSLLSTIELVVPHQANRTMVKKLADDAGIKPDQLYFNIDKVGILLPSGGDTMVSR